MAQMNRQLSGVETIFIPTSAQYSFIASRLLREVARFGGDISAFVPKPVGLRFEAKFSGRTPGWPEEEELVGRSGTTAS